MAWLVLASKDVAVTLPKFLLNIACLQAQRGLIVVAAGYFWSSEDGKMRAPGGRVPLERG